MMRVTSCRLRRLKLYLSKSIKNMMRLMSPTLKSANPNLVLMAKDYATNNVMQNYQINSKIVLDLEVEPLPKRLPLPVKGIEGINSWFSSFHCIWDTLIVFLGDSWIKDSGFRTKFIFYVWFTTRRLIHLVYQFSFHIHVAKCLFDVLVALDVYKIENNEYFVFSKFVDILPMFADIFANKSDNLFLDPSQYIRRHDICNIDQNHLKVLVCRIEVIGNLCLHMWKDLEAA